MLRAVVGSPRHADHAARATKLCERLTGDIIGTARRQLTAEFREHLASYVQPTWHTRFGNPDFVPPVVGSEYDDWEAPNLFRRRRAVRRHPIVIELIGESIATSAADQDYDIPWSSVVASLVPANRADATGDGV